MNARDEFVYSLDAIDFANFFDDGQIDLLCFDPPYYKIVEDSWDNQWQSLDEYVGWFMQLLEAYKPKLSQTGSVVFFGQLGSPGIRPLQKILLEIEDRDLYLVRNQITWKKRRAYGKSHDYLFCREEIVWLSKSKERTGVAFNIPYLSEKRGYEGWNKDYPAKSEYKRVSNVWADIPELMRPERSCQKPVELLDRIVQTHSNPGDLVVDPFAGYGTCGISALKNGRDFVGCDLAQDYAEADARIKTSCKRDP